jgi:hypothetical protein
MSTIGTEVENIENAIESCDLMASVHSSSAGKILFVVMMLTFTLIGLLFVVYGNLQILKDSGVTREIPDPVLYAFLAIYVLTFSVLMATYRLHISEASRLHHYKIGFARIRVAGSNPSAGYQSEVRTALTQGAFDFSLKSEKKGKVESPVPGHPGSDFAAAVANKVLDGLSSSRKSTSRTAEKVEAS